MNNNRFQLSTTLAKQWGHNALVFLAPLGVIYFGALALLLQQEGYAFSVNDLVPSNFTIGAMVLYVTNVLFDLSRKFVSKK